MARLLLLDRPDTLNSGGNVLHVSGMAWAGGYGEPAESVAEVRDVAYPSGAAMAIRRELFLELGGFADELFMYQEDLELAWRVRLRGLRVVVDPAADVLHEYEFGRNPRKLYYLERNRLFFVLTAYSGRLLVLAAPVIAAGEVGTLALAVREGWAREKVAGWRWLVRHAGWVRMRRRETQALRRVRDRELARWLTARIDPAQVPVPAPVRAANPLLRGRRRRRRLVRRDVARRTRGRGTRAPAAVQRRHRGGGAGRAPGYASGTRATTSRCRSTATASTGPRRAGHALVDAGDSPAGPNVAVGTRFAGDGPTTAPRVSPPPSASRLLAWLPCRASWVSG